MSKLLKITLILFVVLFSISSFSLATNIDMNISDDNSDNAIIRTNNTVFNTTTNTISKNDNIKSNSISNQEANLLNDSTTISSVTQSSAEYDSLGLSNILNILLIVVGVVLILLAIAILIRLHN